MRVVIGLIAAGSHERVLRWVNDWTTLLVELGEYHWSVLGHILTCWVKVIGVVAIVVGLELIHHRGIHSSKLVGIRIISCLIS